MILFTVLCVSSVFCILSCLFITGILLGYFASIPFNKRTLLTYQNSLLVVSLTNCVLGQVSVVSLQSPVSSCYICTEDYPASMEHSPLLP